MKVFVLFQTGEQRDVTQMQYLAWPDHGVPDDVNRFLAFTRQVRHERSGMVEPAIVHCSAGESNTFDTDLFILSTDFNDYTAFCRVFDQ